MEFKITQDLAKEASKQYPLASIEMAASFLYGSSHTGNTEKVERLIQDDKLLSITPITTDNNQVVSIPVFQFKLSSNIEDRSGLTIAPIIEKIAPLLNKVDRDAAYIWLTSYDGDLKCAPCEAIHKPELYEVLREVTGMFVNESTLRHLNYIADELVEPYLTDKNAEKWVTEEELKQHVNLMGTGYKRNFKDQQ